MSEFIVAIDRNTGRKPVELQADKASGALLVAGAVSPAPPSAATAVGNLRFTVDDTEAALSGSSPTGFTLLNASTGGQTIYLGDAGVDATTGFPLAPGDALDRASWQDLSIVHAIASAAGADLRAVPL